MDKTLECMMLEGSFYRVLIRQDGKPLPPKKQKAEPLRMRREGEKRRRESAADRAKRRLRWKYSFELPWERIPDLYTFRRLPDEDYQGRPAYVIDAAPRAGVKPSDRNEKEALAMPARRNCTYLF